MAQTKTNIRHVVQGEKVKDYFRARTFNAFADAANWVMEHGDVQGNARANRERIPFEPSMIKAVNEDVVRVNYIGGILGSGLDMDTLHKKAPMSISQPTLQQTGRFAVLHQSGVDVGEISDATAHGFAVVNLRVPEFGAWIERCDVDPDDSDRLIAHPGGSAQIMWKEDDTGTQITTMAIVRLGNPHNVHVLAVAKGELEAGVATGNTVTVWHPATTNTLFDIDDVQLDWMTTDNISDGKQVIITWFPFENVWRVTHAECEDSQTQFAQLGTSTPEAAESLPGTTPLSAIDIDNYDPAFELSSPGLTINSSAGTVQLPDIVGANRLMKVEFNGTAQVDTNNTNVVVSLGVNGNSVQNLSALEFASQNSPSAIAASRYYSVAPQSAPVVSMMQHRTSGGSPNITWFAKNFTITLL